MVGKTLRLVKNNVIPFNSDINAKKVIIIKSKTFTGSSERKKHDINRCLVLSNQIDKGELGIWTYTNYLKK